MTGWEDRQRTFIDQRKQGMEGTFEVDVLDTLDIDRHLRMTNVTGLQKESSTSVLRVHVIFCQSWMRCHQLSDENAAQTLAYMVFNLNCGDDQDSAHQDMETTSSFIAPSNTHVPRSVEGYQWNTQAYAHLPINGKVIIGTSSGCDPEASVPCRRGMRLSYHDSQGANHRGLPATRPQTSTCMPFFRCPST